MRTYGGKRRNFVGQHFWARGYWVSTVGHNEAAVRLYIQEQEKADERLDQLGLFEGQSRFERFTIYKPPALPEVSDCSQCLFIETRDASTLILSFSWPFE